MYNVEFSKTAEKRLYRLEQDIQERIVNVLERIKVRPFNFVKRIINSSCHRLRVGDYRVILDIKEQTQSIFVVELGHRKNIYEQF